MFKRFVSSAVLACVSALGAVASTVAQAFGLAFAFAGVTAGQVLKAFQVANDVRWPSVTAPPGASAGAITRAIAVMFMRRQQARAPGGSFRAWGLTPVL